MEPQLDHGDTKEALDFYLELQLVGSRDLAHEKEDLVAAQERTKIILVVVPAEDILEVPRQTMEQIMKAEAVALSTMERTK
jgi:hypothetical protein